MTIVFKVIVYMTFLNCEQWNTATFRYDVLCSENNYMNLINICVNIQS